MTSDIFNRIRRALKNGTGTTLSYEEMKHLTRLGVMHQLAKCEADEFLAGIDGELGLEEQPLPIENLPRVFTVKTLAAHWSCSEGLVRNMIARGELKAFRHVNLIRITREAVAEVEARRE